LQKSLNYEILVDIDSLASNLNIFLWGSGETGQEFYSFLKTSRPEINVIGFIDSFKHGECMGLPIYKPDEIKKHENVSLIITSMFWGEISNTVEKVYLKKFKILSNSLLNYCSHLRSFGNFYFDTSDIPSLEDRLSFILPSFKSNKDREIFKTLFDLRVNKDESSFMSYTYDLCNKQKLSYQNKDKYTSHINFETIQNAIEGGVYDGEDTYNLLRILGKQKLFKKLYAFEPFIDAFNSGEYFKMIDFKKCEILQNVLWDSCGKVAFNVDINNPGNSSILSGEELDTSNLNNYDSVTIDSFAESREISIDLIKLDVEGAEMNILRGAEHSIAKNKPNLAISIYHRKEDLFEIPELLLKLNPDYKFTMSVSGPSFIDMVLYAKSN
tara:strand:- start:69 stop:1217 length:1149 start_codon:yes stop_codon:yes gene_type:complete